MTMYPYILGHNSTENFNLVTLWYMVIYICELCLLGKDTSSQGYTFLCCCELEFKGTRAHI